MTTFGILFFYFMGAAIGAVLGLACVLACVMLVMAIRDIWRKL